MLRAVRDGIVSTVDQGVTKGRYGVTALTLLTGTEEDGESSLFE